MVANKKLENGIDPAELLTGRGPGQSRVQFAAGQTLYPQGDHADALFYIERGWVKISVVTPGGKEAVVGLHGKGDFFGLGGFTGRRLGTAAALTDGAAIRITADALTHMMRQAPGFAQTFTAYLTRQHLRDQEDLVDHLTASAERRLARTLVRLAEIKEDDARRVPFHINQSMLAEMVGTTRPRINFFINKFKRLGFIDQEWPGGIRVHDGLREFLSRV